MSGHSKWSTIKHKKEAADKKRGTLFSRLSKDITTAVREGGSVNPNDNPRLRGVLAKARMANMPSKNIKRAISRAGENARGKNIEEVIYEGYGPSGVAVICRVRTDNRQRTAAEIKNLFERSGGRVGGPGSASYLFERSEGASFEPKVRIPIAEDRLRQLLSDFVSQLSSREDVVAVYTNADLKHE